MLNLLRVSLVAISLVIAGAVPAVAQQAAPAPAPTEQAATFAVTADQIAAIAVGAFAGAVLLDILGGGGMANLTGAVLGGIVGYWIYTQPAPGTAPQGS
jgi:Ca2+/Na+ antiporter